MGPTNIIIVGLGGQGVNKLGCIVGDILVREGYDVKISCLKGMGQRDGEIIVEIKSGGKVYSPCISEKDADYIIALDKYEALRTIRLLKNDGIMVVYNRFTFHDSFEDKIDSNHIDRVFNDFANTHDVRLVDPDNNLKFVNIIMLKKFIEILGIEKEECIESMRKNLSVNYIKDNIKILMEEGDRR